MTGFGHVKAEEETEGVGTVDSDPVSAKDGSKTDDEVVQREEEAIKLDGLNVAQVIQLLFIDLMWYGSYL